MCTNESHEQDKIRGAKSLKVIAMDVDAQTGDVTMVWLHCQTCNSSLAIYHRVARRAA